MMMTNFGLVFLMTMLMGGITDLLDVIPTSEYWRIKNVQVSEQTVAAELAPPPPVADISKLVEQLGVIDPKAREEAAGKIRAMGAGVRDQLQKATESDNPEIAARARRLIGELQAGGKAQQVRKLMAIRTAGEQKMKNLLPRLKELRESDEMFVADYASAAVAAIEGKPYQRPVAVDADSVWRLPADVRAVYHMSMRGGRVATVEDMGQAVVMGPGQMDAAQKQKMLDQMMRQIVDVADQVGNVRVEGVTMGLAGEVDNNSGYVVFVVNGQFDRAAVANFLAAKVPDAKRDAVAGMDLIGLGKEFGMLLPDDRHAVLIGGPRDVVKPFEPIAQAFKNRQSPLKQSPEMVKLLERVDTKQPIWGAVHVTDAYRRAPLFQSLEWVTLSGTAKGDVLDFRFDAKGLNEAGTREAVAMVTNGLAQAKAMLSQLAPNPPMPNLKEPINIALKLVESIETKVDAADGTKASLTGRLDAPPQTLMGGVFGMFFGMAAPMPDEQGAVEAEVGPIEVKPEPAPLPQPRLE